MNLMLVECFLEVMAIITLRKNQGYIWFKGRTSQSWRRDVI